MTATQQQYYSIEDYLKLEEAADLKSEYIDGQIIPMAGGTANHNQIALNFSTELNFAFKKLDYRVYMTDLRLWIPEKRIFTYPDVMVVAGEPEYYPNRTDMILNPCLIIEVLSKSTQNIDQETKFEIYRTIPTFQEYLLIDQTRIYAEQFYKTGKKSWSFYQYDQEDEAVTLNSVNFKIAITDIYNKLKFETTQT